MMKRANVAGPRRSVKLVTAATALGLVSLGAGVSFASTGSPITVQKAGAARRLGDARNTGNARNAAQVTCVTEVDANAQANAFTAATDVFTVGTKLRVTAGNQAANVVVSSALNANTGSSNNGNAGNNGDARRNRRDNGGVARNNTNAGRNRGNNANAGNNANGNAGNNANNGGVDPNSVCVKLSKAPFDQLSGNGNGENVGTFVVTMVPVGGGNAGNNAGRARRRG